MAGLTAQGIETPNGGIDLVSAPELIPKGRARYLRDFLVDRPGKLPPRGPLVGAALGSLDPASALQLSPLVLAISKRTSGTMWPWETHLGLPNRQASNTSDLVGVSATLRAVDLPSFVASDQALADVGLVPGPRQAVLNGLTYAISLDSAGELTGGANVTLDDGTHIVRRTELLSFNTSGSALPTFPNPSLDTNTTGFTNAGGVGATMARSTAFFDTAPASLNLQWSSAPGTITTTLSGTFKAGVTYTVSFRCGRDSGNLHQVRAVLGTLGNTGVVVIGSGLPSGPNWGTVSMTFTPSVDTANPVLTLDNIGSAASSIFFDTFTVTQTAVNKFGVNAPVAAQDVKAYQGRLFVLGGGQPGVNPVTALKRRTLWWTDPGGPLTRVLAEWQDDTSGLVNQLQVGDDDPTDPGVALGVLPSQLLVFGRRSTWTVLGSFTSGSVSARRVDTVGCLDPRTVVEYQGAVYWLSEQGFMRYDGSTLENVSQTVQPSLLAAADQSVGVGGAAGGTAVTTILPNGYIKLSIGRRDTNTQLFCGLLHVPTGAWTLLSSGAQTGIIKAAFGASGSSYFVDGATLWLADGATLPERNPIAAKGATLADVSRDSIVTISGGVVTVASSSKIPSLWKSRMLQLASPLYSAQLNRLLQDYTWIDPAQTADDASNGWHVSLKNSLGVELLAADLKTQGTSTTKVRRRASTQNFSEASSDVSLEVSVQSGAPAWTTAELYGAQLEYQGTKQRLAE